MTPGILRKLKRVWSYSAEDPDTKLIWAACCLCFFAFLRAGEMTTPDEGGYDAGVHLSFGDIALDNLICASIDKTIQDRPVSQASKALCWPDRL